MASSLHALARPPFRLDALGVHTAWGRAEAHERTVLGDVRKLPCGGCPEHEPRAEEDWSVLLERQVDELARTARAPALALGGGLDAAAVLAAWRASGAALPTVLTLETGLPDYDEVDEARAIARSVGAPCEVIRSPPEEWVALLPEAVALAEEPLYNLHPVGRLALSRAARARGYETLVTGDGADAAFAGRPDLDYVPLVAALTRGAGLALASPFLEGPVLAGTLARAPDRDKHLLREYATARGLPPWLATRPKRSRWMPPMDLSRHLTPEALAPLARELQEEPRLDDDRARVGWATLALLIRSLEGRAGA